MKKTLAVLLTLVLLASLLPCVAVAEGPSIVKYVVPGGAPSGYDFAIEKINAELNKVGIQLGIEYIPWDVWDQKINLMLSTNEPFDLFHVMQTGVSMASYYSRGGLMDLAPYLETEGQAILDTIPANVMEATMINGGCYCIPANWVELGVEGMYTVRNDLLAKYGQDLPTTGAEMLDVLEAIIKEWDGAETPYFTFGNTAGIDPNSTHISTLHTEYDRYPFTTRDNLFFIGQDGTVESWLETEEFKKDCEWMHDAYTRGLIDPDVLSITQEQLADTIARGQYVFCFGTGGSWTDMVKDWPEVTKEDVTVERLYPEKAAVRPFAFKNGNSVPASSQNPAGAVRFLNWLYSSQENYDLFLSGVEGVNYTISDEGVMTSLPTDNSQTWWFDNWMIGNMAFGRIGEGGFPSIENARNTTDLTAENSIAGGFFFDPTEVQAELANVQTEVAAVMAPIVFGVQSYDEYFDIAIERVKAAGLDKVVSAFQEQFAEYQESMGTN